MAGGPRYQRLAAARTGGRALDLIVVAGIAPPPSPAVPAPSVSVAMGTYNGERHLPEQLASLARQTLPPAELVVCDDGSTDGTLAVLEEFAAVAPFPVRIHRNPANLGFAENFLRAAGLCRGELIAFCDQDDVWCDAKLERCRYVLVEQSSVRLVLHATVPVGDDLQPVGPAYPPIRRTHTQSCLVADWTFPVPGAFMVFRASLLALVDAGERPRSLYSSAERAYHDQWLHLLASATGEVAYVSERLALYRQHGGNVVGAVEQGALARVRRALTVGRDDYAAAIVHFEDCVAVLERLATTAAPAQRARLVAVARAYRRLAGWLRVRRVLYEPHGSLPGRLRTMARLLLAGAYRRRCRGGLGASALVKDAARVTLPWLTVQAP